jgi:hypothetical protein
MTFPESVGNLVSDCRPDQAPLRSWILLFGLVPVEYDDLTLVEVEDGRRFLERSEMLTQQIWQHEREILADADGSRIVDRVYIESRIPSLEKIQMAVFKVVFRYRHFRLKRIYGHKAG